MWDERVVKVIAGIARDDLRSQRWARDFADKLRDRKISVAEIERTVVNANAIVLYRHKGRWSIGFWNERVKLIAVWSPYRPSRWVTAFYNRTGSDYLMAREDAELLWSKG
ncbi:MAG: hypothetical protein ACK40X_12745 [Armatimonadota bacterium]